VEKYKKISGGEYPQTLLLVHTIPHQTFCQQQPFVHLSTLSIEQGSNFIAAIAAIAVEGEQNAVDHCGNDGNFLPYSAIFILFTVHYYFDT
jgi:hypothetical protein